jgi:hypothetical protein
MRDAYAAVVVCGRRAPITELQLQSRGTVRWLIRGDGGADDTIRRRSRASDTASISAALHKRSQGQRWALCRACRICGCWHEPKCNCGCRVQKFLPKLQQRHTISIMQHSLNHPQPLNASASTRLHVSVVCATCTPTAHKYLCSCVERTNTNLLRTLRFTHGGGGGAVR